MGSAVQIVTKNYRKILGERDRGGGDEESVQKVCGPNLKPVSPGSVFMGGGGKKCPGQI